MSPIYLFYVFAAVVGIVFYGPGVVAICLIPKAWRWMWWGES